MDIIINNLKLRIFLRNFILLIVIYNTFEFLNDPLINYAARGGKVG